MFNKKKFITNFNYQYLQQNAAKLIIILALFSAALALLSAYIAEFVFGFAPCILCYYQRKPFFIIMIIGLIFLGFEKKLKKYSNLVIYLIFLSIISNICLAFYHSGVEIKIFAGPTTCDVGTSLNIDDLEQLKKALLKTKAVKCDEPQFYLLNLTMANWNLIYNIALLTLLMLIKIRRFKRK